MRRWPGWDGWTLAALSALLIVAVLFRGLSDLYIPVVLATAGTVTFLTATYQTRGVRRDLTRPITDFRPLIFIPTHNNSSTIGSVVSRAATHGNVLVVDDGSTDGSGALAEGAGATVVSHPNNRGKGAALETALAWASEHGFSHLVALDADDQHDPDDLPSFLSAQKARPGALIAGVRDMTRAPKGARYARANSNFWVWVETGHKLGDTQCGFRSYPVQATRHLGLFPSRYQWEVEVLVRSIWSGTPVLDHGCSVHYPPADERVSSYRKFVDTARITWLNIHLIAERILWPPRWFNPVAGGRAPWKGSTRGGRLGWALLLKILTLMGPRATRSLLAPLVWFYWLFAGEQGRATDAYICRRLKVMNPSRQRLAVFQSFARSLVDRFALMSGHDAFDIDRSGVPGLAERLEQIKEEGLVVVSGHLGNPDFAGFALPTRGRKVHVMMFGAEDDPYVEHLRQQPGAPSLIFLNDPHRPASLQALRALRNGDIVAVKADRAVDDRNVRVPFLGSDITLPTGPYLLAALSGAPLLFVGCFEEGPGRYRFIADGPHHIDKPNRKDRDAEMEQWARHWAELMERWTLAYPTQWYNFFDPWRTP